VTEPSTAARPLLSPAQASELLDQVIDDDVLECVDLEALARLEQSLEVLLGGLDGISRDAARTMATAMIDRALGRLPRDVRDLLSVAAWPTFGDRCGEPFGDCGGEPFEHLLEEPMLAAAPPRPPRLRAARGADSASRAPTPGSSKSSA